MMYTVILAGAKKSLVLRYSRGPQTISNAPYRTTKEGYRGDQLASPIVAETTLILTE
jgi:hypothetical protein